MQKVDGGSTKSGFDGITPSILLDKIREKVKKMAFDKQVAERNSYACLEREGLIFKKIEELSKEEFLWVKSYFKKKFFLSLHHSQLTLLIRFL